MPIQKAASGDWAVYVSLKYLTDDFLFSDASKGLKLKNGWLECDNNVWENMPESDISRTQWLEALQRQLELLRAGAPPTVYDAWAAMYTRIFSPTPMPYTYEECREYEEICRWNCSPRGKAMPHWDIAQFWEIARAKMANRTKLAKQKEASEQAARVELLAQRMEKLSSPPSATPGSYAKASQPNAAHQPRQPRDSPRTAQGQYFCIVCGATTHGHPWCSATNQAKHPSRDLLLIKSEGRWVLKSGGAVCFNYNRPRGCANPPAAACPNGSHCCTLCSSTNHGASKCPA